MKSILGTLFTLAITVTTANATDHFLVIGGGYSPTGNQVSLEKNVQLFRKLLKEQYPVDVQHDVYFSDGESPDRDLVYELPPEEAPRVNLLLARILNQSRYFNQHYRSHEIDDIQGGSNREAIKKWFETTGKDLKPGDRLILYVTAHGGRSSDKKHPMNTVLYLWNHEKIQVKELSDWMDMIHPEVEIATIMVQCYSGGFSNIVFKHGDSDAGLTASNRCGFFATVHDRVAAGCTPDIDEDNYREYSTYFWEAIRGETRTGKPVNRPDYNDDGIVAFDEAHAYALLTSPTIDISIKTSGTFLRKYSRTSWPKPATAKPKNGKSKQPAATEPPAPPKPRAVLVTADTPFDQLAALAAPIDRLVIERLSEQLGLEAPKRASAARGYAAKVAAEKKSLDSRRRKKSSELRTATTALSKSLRNKWPELSNRWNPTVNDLITNEADQIVRFIEKHAKFSDYEKARQAVKRMDAEKLDLDRKWVKSQRLLRVLETVALEANLPRVATPEIVERYHGLRALESGHLGSVEPTPTPAGENAAGD